MLRSFECRLCASSLSIRTLMSMTFSNSSLIFSSTSVASLSASFTIMSSLTTICMSPTRYRPKLRILMLCTSFMPSMLFAMSPIAFMTSPHWQASTSTSDASLKMEYAPTKMAAAIRMPAMESACRIPKYLLNATPTATAMEESTSRIPVSPPVLSAVDLYFFDARSIHTERNTMINAAIEATAMAISGWMICLWAIQAR